VDRGAGDTRNTGFYTLPSRPGHGRRGRLGYYGGMVVLDGSSLTLDSLVRIAEHHEPIAFHEAALARVDAARQVVERRAEGDDVVYGVNTGFGALSSVRIPSASLGALQLNLLRSHAAGVGEPLSIPAVRAMMALRANVLAKGYSGIRRETLLLLGAILNRGVHPVVPARGSVGASGDLAPLAHLALVLVGEGYVLHPPGEDPHDDRPHRTSWITAAEALERAGLSPVTLQAKEGLALINGTQASVAALGLALHRALGLARVADLALALSLDALRGSVHPFEPRIHLARPFAGQGTSAANVVALLAGSEINTSHEHCGKVQDAYSLRCAAQVHGAARDALAFIHRTVELEANAGTDNPMVFVDDDEIVSGGNFHGAPVGMAADLLAIAMAQLATISERRSDRLMNPTLSDLPPFLTRNSGLQSGYMLAQVTAAALASEVKGLAHPASVDTIPTSASKEDHVSMSMTAALQAVSAVDLATRVLAIEILCACQGLDLLAPLRSSPALERVRAAVRAQVPTLTDDRPPSPDIEAICTMILNGMLERAAAIDVR
jgi:histidine ammonia-lyase